MGTRNADRIRRAHAFACTQLQTIKRRSGEDYCIHGTEVALTLREITPDTSLLCIALLHDLPVHPQGLQFLKDSPLLPAEQKRVLRMHDLRRLHIDTRTPDLDRMLHAFTDDPRLLLLRMAHRLNDVRHLERFTPTLRRAIARETLHMYAAIAGRLGMEAWRHEMEDRCFRFLHPKLAATVQKAFDVRKEIDTACLRQAKAFLERRLRLQSIECLIEARVKSLYSTYRKMITKNRKFDDMTDRLALRIIVNTDDDCYRVLGTVHRHFHPIPGKLKDYIGLPKENGYRSIHSVIYPLPGITEQPMEIQIRTREMHWQCTVGVASHGTYKTLIPMLSSGPARVDLLRNLQHLRENSVSSKQFEQALRTYFSEQQMAVFDHRNNLYHLRKPATALDFICHVYGKRCRFLKAVRINGRLCDPDAVLHTGDTVQPLFSKSLRLKPAWIYSCRLTSSRELLRGLLTR